MQIKRLIRALRDAPASAFNPWYDYDPDYDRSPHAPRWRRENLQAYLEQRVGSAKWLLIAEAVGFRGAKFSGVAMTCERQLPETDLPHKRTSRDDVPLSGADQAKGVLEPTAVIMARAIAKAGVDPQDVVLWNSFVWHPYKPGLRLTNRTPTPAEMAAGLAVLRQVLALCGDVRQIAIGKTSQRALCETLGLDVPSVRHPANGGAVLFTSQLVECLRVGAAHS